MTKLTRSGGVETDATGQRLFRVAAIDCGGCRGCNAHAEQVLKLPESTTKSEVADGPGTLMVNAKDLTMAATLAFGLPIALALLGTWIVTFQGLEEWLVAATFIASLLTSAIVVKIFLRPTQLLAHLETKPWT